MGFRKITNKEYEVEIEGRTKTILVPFGKTERIFQIFISNGGVIDPVTGEVQTDIISLISSFKSVGNVLLTDYDEQGKVIKEGNCSDLDGAEVITLFQVATSVIENFIKELTAMQKTPEIPNPQSDEENGQKKKTKA